jgi:Arc-like DNA binding dprotein
MTITVAAVVGLIIGLTVGAVITGLALTERRSRHWIVCLRLPKELHRSLREEATVAGWSLKAEIISRLQASFHQPNGDQVVDAPRL